MNPIRFEVYGRPQQRGSKRAIPNRNGGRPLMVDDNSKSKPWMAAVSAAAAETMNGAPLIEGPVKVEAVFLFKRPKKHFRSNGNLRADAPLLYSSAPDCDKLMRSIGDAMTGVVYRDDAQIAELALHKRYTDTSEGAAITVVPLAPAAGETAT